MELVKVWGWLLTLICGVYILRPSTCEIVLSMMERKEFVLISGWFSLFLGVPTFILSSSNTPELKVLGLIFLLNGLIRLGAPKMITKKAPFLKENKQIPLSISAIGLIFGLWLLLHY